MRCRTAEENRASEGYSPRGGGVGDDSREKPDSGRLEAARGSW
jgi:hypothetical protein